MRSWLIIALLFIVDLSYAQVDTVKVYSHSMKKNIKCVVITPADYQTSSERFPVLYLLHGYSGDHTNWIRRVPDLDSLADVYQMIIVCPDAAVDSWYFDSPIDPTYRYETFIARELPVHIDANYRTLASRKGRAITGLSMGGHGAYFIALRHPQTFGACGSMSGALNISLIAKGFDLPKRLGDTVLNRNRYIDWSVVNMLDHYDPKDSIAFIFDCGVRDFLYAMSKATHEKMLQLKIPHDYIERPGTHDWKYWGNAIKYQLLFFREWFKKNM